MSAAVEVEGRVELEELGQWGHAWRRLRRNRLAMVALGYLVLIALLAMTYPWWWPHEPTATDFGNTFAAPSGAHWLGTDDLGRDQVARLLAGGRISMRASLQVVATALLASIPIGLLAGYLSGAVDNLVMRVVDALQSVPALILALALAGTLGPGLTNAMIALSIVFTPTFIRLIRGQTLAVREETFVEASRSIGTRTPRVLASRILPNVSSPLIVQASIALGGALLAEAALSFLGVGVQPPNASWGSMLRRAYANIFTHPWAMVTPGAAIALAVLAFNTLGDGLRDALGVGAADTSVRKRPGSRGMTHVAAEPGPRQVVAPDPDRVLEVEDLRVAFDTESGPVTVVDRVSLTVHRGEVLGLVGESGSGKTVTSLAVMRLVPSPPGEIVGGSVRFEGRDLLAAGRRELSRVRGGEIAMVFQDPMSSLNPAFTVGDQLVEAIRLHQDVSRRAARERSRELLELVGIPFPAQRLKQYPHEFSGGMRQRAVIAMALSCDPKLIIADEPTTALDVTVQAQILELLRDLQRERGMAMIFVTHDLGVVADMADRVAVMYAGQVVEEAAVSDLFHHPRHPYTEGLLAAMPQSEAEREELYAIPGRVPSPDRFPGACRFHPRCPYVREPVCTTEPIPLTPTPIGQVRCARHADLELKGAGGEG